MALVRQFVNKRNANSVNNYFPQTNLPYTKQDNYYTVSAPTGKTIIKLGYNCEPKGCGHRPGSPSADYPIYIYQNNLPEPVEIEVGKTYTYEAVEDENNLSIQKVRVPANIEFSLDLVLKNIN